MRAEELMGINHPVIPRIVAIRPEPSQSEDGETTSPSCLIFYEDGSVTRSFHSAEDEFFSFSRFIAHKMYGSNYKGDPYHQHKLGYVLLDDYIFLKMEMQTLSPTCGYVCLQDIDCVKCTPEKQALLCLKCGTVIPLTLTAATTLQRVTDAQNYFAKGEPVPLRGQMAFQLSPCIGDPFELLKEKEAILPLSDRHDATLTHALCSNFLSKKPSDLRKTILGVDKHAKSRLKAIDQAKDIRASGEAAGFLYNRREETYSPLSLIPEKEEESVEELKEIIRQKDAVIERKDQEIERHRRENKQLRNSLRIIRTLTTEPEQGGLSPASPNPVWLPS